MKRLLTLLFLLSFTVLSAQEFHVSYSEEMNAEDGINPMPVGDEYIGFNTGTKMQFAYTFKLDKVKYNILLRKYDSKMKMVKELKLSNGEKVYGPFYPYLLKYDNRPFFLYYQLGEKGRN